MGIGLRVMEYQEFLALKAGAAVLEADPHGEKVLLLSDGTILKLFRRKRLLTSAAWYPYARRFVHNADALEHKGIPVPRVIAAFRIPEVQRDAVHYHPLEGVALRQLVRQGLDSEAEQMLKQRFTEFVIHLHTLGVYFRSLHLGNVILTPAGQLGLIDFADLRVYPCSLPKFMRRRNLQRMLGINSERGWIDSQAILDCKTST